jgi:nucleoside-triphosphatase THEP1
VGAINQAIRPEPVAINIYGPPGHGKTHFVANTLIPWLTNQFHLNGKVVNATGIHGEYFPPISDEDIIVIDEFGHRHTRSMAEGVECTFLTISYES